MGDCVKRDGTFFLSAPFLTYEWGRTQYCMGWRGDSFFFLLIRYLKNGQSRVWYDMARMVQIIPELLWIRLHEG
jgi:hypothetical protein